MLALALAALLAVPTVDVFTLVDHLMLGCCCIPLFKIRESHYVPDPYRSGGYVVQEYNVLMNDDVWVYRQPKLGLSRRIASSSSEHDTFFRHMELTPSENGLLIRWNSEESTFIPETSLRLWRWTDSIDSVVMLLVAFILLRRRGPRHEMVEPQAVPG